MEPIIISASFFQEQPSLGVLGRTGEHYARRISFDCGEVLKTWPEATILCVCRRPCDTAAYPIPLTADGTTYTMPLTSRETAAAGAIKLELRAVWKRFMKSLSEKRTLPAQYDEMGELIAEAYDETYTVTVPVMESQNVEMTAEEIAEMPEPMPDPSDARMTEIEAALI